jgi:hypothetical protein
MTRILPAPDSSPTNGDQHKGIAVLHQHGLCGGYEFCPYCEPPREARGDPLDPARGITLSVALGAIVFLCIGALVAGLLIAWGWGPQ